MSLVIGRIYIMKTTEHAYRIFRAGGSGWYSGRGSTPQTAVPYNYLKRDYVRDATLQEVNEFLEEEMLSGMAQKTNHRLTIKQIPV